MVSVMAMKLQDIEKLILQEAPFAYSSLLIIPDKTGKPIDFLFHGMNPSFENIMGLKAKTNLNKRFSEILSNTNTLKECTKLFGQIIIEGKESKIEFYDKESKKWFCIQLFSPKSDIVTAIFTDITIDQLIANTTKFFFENPIDARPDYQAISDTMLHISGAKFVGFNIFEEGSLDYTTVSLSGINAKTKKGLSMLGFNPVGKRWAHDPIRASRIEDSTTTVFERLSDLTGNIISQQSVKAIEALFQLGNTIIVKIMKDGVMLGDFTLILSSKKRLSNISQVEMYAQQVGMLLERCRINQKIKQSEEKYRHISENISDVVWTMDLNLNLTYISPSGERLSGIKTEDYLKRNILENFSPESVQKIMKTYEAEMDYERNSEHKDSGRSIYLELEHLLPDNKSVWIGMSISILRNEKGEIIGFQGVSRDISLQIEAEQKLRESEERFKTMFYESPTSIIIHDKDTFEIVDANKMAYETYGFQSLEELQKNDFWLEPPYSFKEASEYIKKAAAGIPQEFEWLNQKKNAEFFWEYVTLKRIVINETVRVLSTSIDITDRKIIEQEIIDSRNNLAEAQKIARMGSWEWIVSNDELRLSQEFFEVTGIEHTKRYKTLTTFLDRIHPDDINVFHNSLENNVESFEFRVIQKDGTIRHILSKCKIESSPLHTLTRITGTAQDISFITNEELKQTLHQLHELTNYIETLREEERKALSRDLHDDLGQTLTAIKLELDSLKYNITDALIVEKIEKISSMIALTMQSVQRIMTRLRPDLLNDLGLEAALEWLIKEYKKTTNIQVDMRMPQDIVLEKDVSLHIFRIIQESLTNISKHAKANMVKIILSQKGGYLNIWITDNGIGIDTQKIEKGKSFGIIGMRERAANMGGTFNISKGSTIGTKIEINIPLKP